MIILETERLTLREISLNDIRELSKILQNPKSMLPWHELFTNQELCNWIVNNIEQYNRYNTGYLAVIRKNDKKFIGIIRIIKVHTKKSKFYELGYILKNQYQKQGYATEGIRRCIKYISEKLKIQEVYSCTNTSNHQSQKLINSLGFKFVENYTLNRKYFSKYKLMFLK